MKQSVAVEQYFHKGKKKDEVAMRTGFREVHMTASAGNPRTIEELNFASLVFQVMCLLFLSEFD